MCCQLSSRKVDAPSVINWTVVGQLIAKFHYAGPTKPDRTRADKVRGLCRRPTRTRAGPTDSVGDPGLVWSGPVRSGRARVEEFNYKSTVPPSSDARLL